MLANKGLLLAVRREEEKNKKGEKGGRESREGKEREEPLSAPEKAQQTILFGSEQLPNRFNVQVTVRLTSKNFLPANSCYSNQLEEMW